jgi:DNA-binding transcriptional ArsR family regulator
LAHRAVFHFLTNDPHRIAYVEQVRRCVRPGNFVVLLSGAGDFVELRTTSFAGAHQRLRDATMSHAYAERVLDALGDSPRRLVFARLKGRARSVGEIATGMNVSRSAVSQHLKVLKDARLVTARAEGTRRVYAVEPRGVEAVRGWLDGFWDETLAAFKMAAEREAAKERKPR